MEDAVDIGDKIVHLQNLIGECAAGGAEGKGRWEPRAPSGAFVGGEVQRPFSWKESRSEGKVRPRHQQAGGGRGDRRAFATTL